MNIDDGLAVRLPLCSDSGRTQPAVTLVQQSMHPHLREQCLLCSALARLHRCCRCSDAPAVSASGARRGPTAAVPLCNAAAASDVAAATAVADGGGCGAYACVFVQRRRCECGTARGSCRGRHF
eukprot:363419-Chlamydomonas_euryale.AAC.20